MRKIYLNTLTPEEIIKRLKNGEVIHFETGDFILKMIEGVIVKICRKSTKFNYAFTVDEVNDYYFEEDEPYEITETGVYKTRDGRKAYVSYVDDYVYGVIDGEKGSWTWDLDGHWKITSSEEDIVAKWED